LSATVATFGALTLAVACLWLPRGVVPRPLLAVWALPAAFALILALAGGLIAGVGVLAVVSLAAACRAANHAGHSGVRLVAHVLTLGLCAALFLHAVAGFANPRVLDGVVLSPDASPYTKYLNFDKGMAGLLLLGLYVPERVERDRGARHGAGVTWRFVVVVLVTMGLAIQLSYVRWDPKLPSFWPMWLWSMVVLTALPEEALFRGVIQTWIADGLLKAQGWPAIVIAAVVFGVAHLAGGPLSVLVASVAGVGYGWIYASTRSIAAAIVAHAGLNAVHFFLFSYPALAGAG
jgi:hypothetical protein